ncbi:TIGR03086 family metal-binding protein [Amycolatopsis sp. BJA-103]|uniref:TIGR03086 family metal-binding protein n=1 Tax=Amycolatopsis sp. BJA-103 TaxID=1911175 RepID=UPI000C7777CF|nr:TIGR03086 family metal-binding protein [Amycolatopsis sp. BJA-103]AUI61373.1 TIGR03086 family protein [Amycolatopsis sp. BJA-103]PNE21336.1 TIGR03086 family protein [Amycolatopsis sp. BJA-103]
METDETLDRYRRTQDAFEAVLAAVSPERWNSASACEHWTVRDVAGHVIWGLEVLRHHLAGEEYAPHNGPAGSEKPGELAGEDPLAGWRETREATAALFTGDVLTRPAPAWYVANRPGVTVTDYLALLTFDTLVHTWDVGSALGVKVTMEADIVAPSFSLARLIISRTPDTFGPKVKPAPGADQQTRFLAFLGRSA